MVCIKTLLLAFCGAASALPVTPGSDSRLAVPETKDFDATDASDIEKRSVSLPNNHVSKLVARVSPVKLFGIYTLAWEFQGGIRKEVLIQVGHHGEVMTDSPGARVSYSRYENAGTLLVSYESGDITARSQIEIDARTKYIRDSSTYVQDRNRKQVPNRFRATFRPVTEPGVPLPRPQADIRRPSSSQSGYQPIGGGGQYPPAAHLLPRPPNAHRLPPPPMQRPSTSNAMFRPGQIPPGAQALPRPPSRGQYPPGTQAFSRPPGSGQYPPGYRPSRGPY